MCLRVHQYNIDNQPEADSQEAGSGKPRQIGTVMAKRWPAVVDSLSSVRLRARNKHDISGWRQRLIDT